MATALHTGAEIWLRTRLDARRRARLDRHAGIIRAGALHDGMLLVDGGLVNPVPVSLARAMGADIVIAVDLGSDILGRHLRASLRAAPLAGAVGDWIRKLQDNLGVHFFRSVPAEEWTMPTIFEVVASSINIMQVRIARSRMAGDPPDVVVAPRLAHLRLLDFHRAKEAIEEGHRAVERVAHTLKFSDHQRSPPTPEQGLPQ